MIPLLCLGDSLATYQGVGQHLGCEIAAEVGRHTSEMLPFVREARTTVISAGSNDEPGPALRRALALLRLEITGNVIWILPAEEQRATIVREVAQAFGDRSVIFEAGPDGVHPADYEGLAALIRARIGHAS